MRDPRTPKHIKLVGQPDVAGAHLPLGVSKLEDEYRESPPYEVPHQTRYLVGQDYTTESRIHGDQHYVTVIGGAECRDKLGFLLVRDGERYNAHYNDGVVENIYPIDGQPRPEPDPADRTKGYKVPTQLRVGAASRTQASKFSGLMRLVVGCYHAAGKDAPFSYTFAKTHGILKLDVPVGNPPVLTTRYWVTEISPNGIFAAPIVNTGKCCDSWSIARYIPTTAEVEENPSLQQFRDELSLANAWLAGRPGVLLLQPPAAMNDAYSSGSTWYPDCGWAFSASGVNAQNVVVFQSTSPLPLHYRCSRFKINFSLQPDGNPTATITEEESNKVAAFPNFSGVWMPTGPNTWQNTESLTAAQQLTMPHVSQDAPIHVYYVGEQEIITRWQLAATNQPARLTPCTTGYLKQYAGTPRYCRLIVATGPIVPICQGIVFAFLAEPPPTNELFIYTGPDNNFATTNDGLCTHGGTHTDEAAHFKVVAGFVSPVFSSVRERSSKTMTVKDTRQEAEVVETETTAPSLYTLHPSCYYTIIQPFPPFNPVLITFGPVIQRTTRYGAVVYNHVETGSFTKTARTNFAMFHMEREAGLHIMRDADISSGSQFNESLSSNPSAFFAHTKTTIEKIADTGTGPYPPGSLFTPFTNSQVSGNGSIAQTAATVDTTVTPLDTFTPTAVAQLNVGPLQAGVTIPSETVAGGFMPTSTLSPFIFGNFASPPIGVIEIASAAFAQHGNLYYDDPELEPPGQSGNAVYLLEAPTIVTAGGFDANINQVVAFVGKA